MNSFFRKILDFFQKDPQAKQNFLIVVLIVSALVIFVILLNGFFKKNPIPPKVKEPYVVSGNVIVSEEVSKAVIEKIKKDLKLIKNELNDDFYLKLRVYRPSEDSASVPGRQNPFLEVKP